LNINRFTLQFLLSLVGTHIEVDKEASAVVDKVYNRYTAFAYSEIEYFQ